MKIREKLGKIREALKELFGHSIYEAAEFNGLAIECWKNMGPKYDGHLDTTNEKPRFIGVDPDLPKEAQVYVIAREIGRYGQLRQIDSPFIHGPRKWNLLATASPETRNLIYRLDIEVRAYWIMYWHAGRHGLFRFYKHHPKKYLTIVFADNISDFIFLKLRIRNFLYGILSTLHLMKSKPIVPIF